MSEWMLRRGRRAPVGPVNTERLVRAIRVGRVPPDTEACRVGSDEWRPYASFPEVQTALDANAGADPGRASEVPLGPLESERAGPNTERSAGAPRPPGPLRSAPLAERLPGPESDDEDEATLVVKSTPFAAERTDERAAPRPAAGVPPPKPAGWPSTRPVPAAPAVSPPRPGVPRPAGGNSALKPGVLPPRPTSSQLLSSPIALSAPLTAPLPVTAPESPRPAPASLPPVSAPTDAPEPPPPPDAEEEDDNAQTRISTSLADSPTNRPPGLKPLGSGAGPPSAPHFPPPEPQPMVVGEGGPRDAVGTPLPVPPVMIAPPEPTHVRAAPPPRPPPQLLPSYPPPPVLDATTKALIALIVALSIGLAIVLFLLWQRS